MISCEYQATGSGDPWVQFLLTKYNPAFSHTFGIGGGGIGGAVDHPYDVRVGIASIYAAGTSSFAYA